MFFNRENLKAWTGRSANSRFRISKKKNLFANLIIEVFRIDFDGYRIIFKTKICCYITSSICVIFAVWFEKVNPTAAAQAGDLQQHLLLLGLSHYSHKHLGCLWDYYSPILLLRFFEWADVHLSHDRSHNLSTFIVVMTKTRLLRQPSPSKVKKSELLLLTRPC